jgi:tRNA threonylcarbamoyladenosine biosynthesis protein TsaB
MDTSTPAVSVALVSGDGTICANRCVIEQNRHGELLAPMINETLAAAGVLPSALSAVGVGLGPGPFTGLRVGIVTAKAMSDALGVPARGACSLDLVADRHRDRAEGFAVLSDARRRQLYWALYDSGGRRLDGPDLGRPDAVADLLRGRAAAVMGAGAQLYPAAFAGFEIADAGKYPSAVALARRVMAEVGAGEPATDLAPIYLRRPDAQPPGAPKRVIPA